jgi:hypothetical protein
MIVKQAGREDLNLRHFASAGKVFIQTPLRKLLRTLPERPVDLGGERNAFDLNVFVLESWLSATKRKTFNPESYEAMEAFSKYITRIDDILDTFNHPPITDWNSTYRTDIIARKNISIFVHRVCEMGKKDILTPEQVKNIFNVASDYRRRARTALGRFESLQDPQINEILKVKEETTGGMGAVMIEILSTAESISASQQKILAKAFSDSFMATQIADDMHDIHEDMQKRVPNIAVSVLRKYPNEFDSLVQSGTTTINAYKELAPKSYTELMQIGQDYTLRIPQTPESIRVLEAIPKIFYKIAQLTSRGN